MRYKPQQCREKAQHMDASAITYGQTCALLAHEYVQLKEAYRNHIKSQKARLAEEIEYLRELQAKENLHELGLSTEGARHDAVDAA